MISTALISKKNLCGSDDGVINEISQLPKPIMGGSFPARIWAEFVKGYLKKSPVQEFPAPAYIGGTEAINFINAVPEMDPALIPPSPSPTKKKR